MSKRIEARLKATPLAVVTFEDTLDFDKDWIEASAIVENAKRRLFSQLKAGLHEKIATLSIDDLEFKFCG